MRLPTEPVTLTPEQIGELNKKLSTMRHDVNNNLALVTAAVEIIRCNPAAAERMSKKLSEKPQQISAAVAQFSRDLESALRIEKT